MNVHLVDGTYELFRHHYGGAGRGDESGSGLDGVRGVVGSLLSLVRDGATHLAVATDHVIESFRNQLYQGYKDGSDIEPVLLRQFEPLEEALEAAGFVLWPMVEFEADDALASGAALAAADPSVERVFLCTPDKDLAQCVIADRVVQFDRRRGTVLGAEEVHEKFGVLPDSIPDYLALVGDSSDGFPGLPGWGAKSAAVVLDRYGYLEGIPDDPAEWEVKVRGASRLARTLADNRQEALLFRTLATLRRDVPISQSVAQLEWRGPAADGAARLEKMRLQSLARTAAELAARPE